MDNKYIKVTYQTDPIGEENIVLELVTFDLEAFKRDEQMKSIPKKTVRSIHHTGLIRPYENLSQIDTHTFLEYELEHYIDHTYRKQLDDMAKLLEVERQIMQSTAVPLVYRGEE